MRIETAVLCVAGAMLVACGGDKVIAGPPAACDCIFPWATTCDSSCKVEDAVVQSVQGDTVTVATVPQAGAAPVTRTIPLAALTASKMDATQLKPGVEVQLGVSKAAPLNTRSIVLKNPKVVNPNLKKLTLPAQKK